MEKASGKSFPVLLKEYLTDTLKLTNTVVDDPFITISGRTDYFDYNIVSQDNERSILRLALSVRLLKEFFPMLRTWLNSPMQYYIQVLFLMQ